jgi:hypothetical protein
LAARASFCSSGNSIVSDVMVPLYLNVLSVPCERRATLSNSGHIVGKSDGEIRRFASAHGTQRRISPAIRSGLAGNPCPGGGQCARNRDVLRRIGRLSFPILRVTHKCLRVNGFLPTLPFREGTNSFPGSELELMIGRLAFGCLSSDRIAVARLPTPGIGRCASMTWLVIKMTAMVDVPVLVWALEQRSHG